MSLKHNFPVQPVDDLRIDTAFREIMSGQSINRKYAGVIPDGVYFGFNPVWRGNYRFDIGSATKEGKAIVTINGFQITVTLPAGKIKPVIVSVERPIVALQVDYKQAAGTVKPDPATDADGVQLVAIAESDMTPTSTRAFIPLAKMESGTGIDLRKPLEQLITKAIISQSRASTDPAEEVPSVAFMISELDSVAQQISGINQILQSGTANLDNLQEIVDFISLNRAMLELAIQARAAGGTATEPLRLTNPAGGAHHFANRVTGALKIKLPVSWTSSYVAMTIDVIDAIGNKSFSLKVSGVNYAPDSRWYGATAFISGSPNADIDYQVTLGHDGDSCCVWIGTPDSDWEFPSVSVKECEVAAGTNDADSWQSGWSVSLDTQTPPGAGQRIINQTMIGKYVNGTRVSLEGHRHDNATPDSDGFMSKVDKSYIAGLPGTLAQLSQTTANAVTLANDSRQAAEQAAEQAGVAASEAAEEAVVPATEAALRSEQAAIRAEQAAAQAGQVAAEATDIANNHGHDLAEAPAGQSTGKSGFMSPADKQAIANHAQSLIGILQTLNGGGGVTGLVAEVANLILSLNNLSAKANQTENALSEHISSADMKDLYQLKANIVQAFNKPVGAADIVISYSYDRSFHANTDGQIFKASAEGNSIFSFGAFFGSIDKKAVIASSEKQLLLTRPQYMREKFRPFVNDTSSGMVSNVVGSTLQNGKIFYSPTSPIENSIVVPPKETPFGIEYTGSKMYIVCAGKLLECSVNPATDPAFISADSLGDPLEIAVPVTNYGGSNSPLNLCMRGATYNPVTGKLYIWGGHSIGEISEFIPGSGLTAEPPYKVHADSVTGIACNPDTGVMVAVSSLGAIKVFNPSTQAWSSVTTKDVGTKRGSDYLMYLNRTCEVIYCKHFKAFIALTKLTTIQISRDGVFWLPIPLSYHQQYIAGIDIGDPDRCPLAILTVDSNSNNEFTYAVFG